MLNCRNVAHLALPLALAAFLVLAGTGCPVFTQGKTQVTVLMAGDASAPAKALLSELKAEVDPAAIASLKVTVTEIVLDYAGPVTDDVEDDGDDLDDEGEGAPEAKDGPADGLLTPKIVVFSGEQQIDLVDLTGVSAILSSAEIPAGLYTKVRLSIKDPVLVLADDAEGTEITDIKLTANGRLFVSTPFTLPEGQASLLVLDFNGLHLVPTGSGKYVLTPQLRADISVTDAAVVLNGTVSTIDAATSMLQVVLDGSGDAVDVNYADAVIWLPGDVDEPTGSAADLVPGAVVTITGTLTVSEAVHADTIVIAPVVTP